MDKTREQGSLSILGSVFLGEFNDTFEGFHISSSIAELFPARQDHLSLKNA